MESGEHSPKFNEIGKEIVQEIVLGILDQSFETKNHVNEECSFGMEDVLKKCQEELAESVENGLVKENKLMQLEKELKTQANMLQIEFQLKHEEDILENKALKKKVEKIEKENEELKNKIDSLYEGLEKMASNPTNSESFVERDDLLKSYKATQVLLQQKCLDTKKSDEMNSELTIRLELEHERRIRAQTEIGEIEKERMVLQNELESKSTECIEKSQEYEEVKLGCDYKLSKYTAEIQKLEAKLEKVILEKDKRILTLQSRNADMSQKLESSEERYNNQVEVSKTLQNELQSSYVETQSLIKEMEMLNLMFAELDHHIFSGQPLGAGSSKSEAAPNGKQIQIDEVLKIAQSTEPSASLLQQSCHNEVTTKNGTKMVLSVSKTFLKLKDLILEKNTMEEQMMKMKHMNDILCSQVNLHEEKLCDITDELNNTWFYVSKIKEQHKKLHSSEQILRAELAEKRKLLNNIRKELEESKASMDLVKRMNDESEKQCVQLRADFVERKRLLTSSPESGISDIDIEDKTEDIDSENEKCTTQNSKEVIAMDDHVTDPYDDSDTEEIPDPFSDDEDEENVEALDRLFCPMVQSFINEIDEVENESVEEEEDNEPGFTPIFVPSLSFLAQVPASMQPNILASEKEEVELDTEVMPRDRLDENVIDEVDDNVRDLINRLSSSTSRGAFLANRLSDIHRRIATGTSLTDHNDWFDDNAEDTESDLDARETTEDDELNNNLENETEDLIESSTSPDPIEDLDEEERPSSTDSLVLAIDEAINILDPVSMSQLPLAPLQPNNSFFPSPLETQNVPNTRDNESDDDENTEEAVGSADVPESSDSSAEVTRFLIKHLPKQLTQLRNEKHELEDKIHDFEQIVSEQRMQMSEHERRVEIERSKTKKLEERLKLLEEKASEASRQNSDIPLVFTVPVEVEEENMVLNWTVESKAERPCGYWVSFITQGAGNSDAVIMPNIVSEVVPMDVGISTSLRVDCIYRGRYTLHIQGNDSRMPQVTVNLSSVAKDDGGLEKK